MRIYTYRRPRNNWGFGFSIGGWWLLWGILFLPFVLLLGAFVVANDAQVPLMIRGLAVLFLIVFAVELTKNTLL